MLTTASHIATCARLTNAISKSRSVEEIYSAALDALGSGLGVERASILLFDAAGGMPGIGGDELIALNELSAPLPATSSGACPGTRSRSSRTA